MHSPARRKGGQANTPACSLVFRGSQLQGAAHPSEDSSYCPSFILPLSYCTCLPRILFHSYFQIQFTVEIECHMYRKIFFFTLAQLRIFVESQVQVTRDKAV